MAPQTYISILKSRSLPSALIGMVGDSSISTLSQVRTEDGGIHPVLVLCIIFTLFLIMLIFTFAFSIWQWRRAKRHVYESIEAPPIRPGDLYYRRVQRNRPTKQVRWQTLVFDDAPPFSATSTTRLLSNDSTRVNPPTARVSYGAMGARLHRNGDTPPPYSPRYVEAIAPQYRYDNLPSTTTTIDSAVMDCLSPPPIPQKSNLRRPPRLNLMISSPEMQQTSEVYSYQRHPTPYPLREQLSPSPISTAVTPSSPHVATVITLQAPQPRLKVQKSMLSPGRVSSSPNQITPVTV